MWMCSEEVLPLIVVADGFQGGDVGFGNTVKY